MAERGFRVLTIIRKNLSYLRRRVKQKSLDEMCKETGIARDTLHKIENNDTRDKTLFPNLKTLVIMAEYFNVELFEFISRDMEMDEIDKLEERHTIALFSDGGEVTESTNILVST